MSIILFLFYFVLKKTLAIAYMCFLFYFVLKKTLAIAYMCFQISDLL